MLGIAPKQNRSTTGRSTTGGSNVDAYELQTSRVDPARGNGDEMKLGDGRGQIVTTVGRAQKPGSRDGSVSSTKSDAMIIKRTDVWQVHYENSAAAASLDPRQDVQDRV
jgi:hypothetical protein